MLARFGERFVTLGKMNLPQRVQTCIRVKLLRQQRLHLRAIDILQGGVDQTAKDALR